jgi:hypothetical protein
MDTDPVDGDPPIPRDSDLDRLSDDAFHLVQRTCCSMRCHGAVAGGEHRSHDTGLKRRDGSDQQIDAAMESPPTSALHATFDRADGETACHGLSVGEHAVLPSGDPRDAYVWSEHVPESSGGRIRISASGADTRARDRPLGPAGVVLPRFWCDFPITCDGYVSQGHPPLEME